MLLYLSLLVSGGLAATLVWRYDLYDREPVLLVVLAVGLGYAAMWGLGPAETVVIDDWLGSNRAGTIALVSAGLEELAKLAVVLAIARTFSVSFDDPMDGVIYGSMAGLGAAIQESVGLLSDANDLTVVPPEELVRLCGHLIMGGMAGAGAGLVAVGHRRRFLVLGLGLAAAVLLHFVWDYVALVSPITTDDPTYVLLRCAIVGVGLVAYGWLVAQFSRISRAYLDPGASTRLWGWPFVRGAQAGTRENR